MNNELISIIVPIYNVEHYLPKCIDSILVQSYGYLEIILVNDGSTDNCGKICDEYARKDVRIKVIHQKNQGLSAARNVGISIAKGVYVGFVDSDDWIVPDMYHQLLTEIVRQDADMVQCGIYYNTANGIFTNCKGEAGTTIYTVVEDFMKALLTNRITNSAWNKLYKRELLDETIFPVGLYFEDGYATSNVIQRCRKIILINTPYYVYNSCREGSICNTYTVERMRQRFEAIVYRTKEIQKRYPALSSLVATSQITYDCSLYFVLYDKIEDSTERASQIQVIRTNLKQYSVSELLRISTIYIPSALIIRYLPKCYPVYGLMGKIVRYFFKISRKSFSMRRVDNLSTSEYQK